MTAGIALLWRMKRCVRTAKNMVAPSHAAPSAAKPGTEQGHGAGHFNQTRNDAEPLPHADLVEDLNHHRRARQLGAAGSQKGGSEKPLKHPGADSVSLHRCAGYRCATYLGSLYLSI